MAKKQGKSNGNCTLLKGQACANLKILAGLAVMALGTLKRRVLPAPAVIHLWGRMFVAFLFVFYLNYLPLHLISEPHYHDSIHFDHANSSQPHDEHDPEHNDHDTHHVPHPAAEHIIQMIPKPQSHFIYVAVLYAAIDFLIEAPETPIVLSFLDWGGLPGESPPQPLLPRAPPIC